MTPTKLRPVEAPLYQKPEALSIIFYADFPVLVSILARSSVTDSKSAIADGSVSEIHEIGANNPCYHCIRTILADTH